MKGPGKAGTKAGVGSTVNNTVTSVRETEGSVVISIISLVSLGNENKGLDGGGDTSFENVLKMRGEDHKLSKQRKVCHPLPGQSRGK